MCRKRGRKIKVAHHIVGTQSRDYNRHKKKSKTEFSTCASFWREHGCNKVWILLIVLGILFYNRPCKMSG